MNKKLEVPPAVKSALTQQREDERNKRVERRRAELEKDRAWAAERERLRPRARVILDWAAALAEAGLVPERGILVDAKTGSYRVRDGIIVRPDGALSIFHTYQPFYAGSRDARVEDDLLRGPSDAAVVQDLAAAIESGEVWQRVLDGRQGIAK